MNVIDSVPHGEELVASFLVSNLALARLYMDAVQPEFFRGDATRWLIGHAKQTWQEIRDLPAGTTIVAAFKVDADAGRVPWELQADIEAVLQRLSAELQRPENLSLPAIVEKALPEWMQQRACTVVATDLVDQLAKGRLRDDIVSRFTKALSIGMGSVEDLPYIVRDADAFFDLLEARNRIGNALSFGIPQVDQALGGGVYPGHLVAFLAGTGIGKSHALCWVGAQAVQQGKKVIHITAEMSREETFARYAAIATGIDSRRILDEPSTARDRYHETVVEWAGEAVVVGIPSHAYTVTQVRGLIEQIKLRQEFQPDVIVVDYADLLLPSNGEEKTYEAQMIVYEELRGIGQIEEAVVVTAAQTNRGGQGKARLGLADVGDSHAKTRVCDFIIALEMNGDATRDYVQPITLNPIKVRAAANGIGVPLLLDKKTSRFTFENRSRVGDRATNVVLGEVA